MAAEMTQETGQNKERGLKNQIFPVSNKMRYQALFPRVLTGVDTDYIIMTTFVNGSYGSVSGV